MKTRLFKTVLALTLALIALPMMGQDFMNVYFKDGTTRKFYLKGVTEISTSQYDASGIRHSDYDFQHVKTLNNTYVYRLDDVDSIAFSKFDEEKTRQDFSSAMTATVQSLSICESIDDAEKMLGQIKAAKGVEDAWSDGDDLLVKINQWETISFHFSHDDDGLIKETESSVRRIREMIPQLSQQFEGKGRRPRVVFANQRHYESWIYELYESRYKPLLEDFAACGFDTCYLAKPTLDFFAKDIFKYDFIFLITHGGYSNKKHRILSGERLGEIPKSGESIPQETWDKWLQALKELNENTRYEKTETVYRSCNEETRGNKTYWVSHPGIYETFYNSPEEGGLAVGTFPSGSILFNASCHSMDGEDLESSNSFAKKLTDRNLRVYYGYVGATYDGPIAGCDFYESLLKGKATGTAFVELPESLRVEKDKPECAVLAKYAPEGQGLAWIGPLVTRPLENEKATEEYTLNNKLVLSATMTSIDPNAIEKGFIYGTRKHSLSEMVYSDLVMKTLNFGEGNYLYSSAVSRLEKNTNYFYCAFTYDGLNCHYGDTLKFCIGTPEELQISSDKLDLTIDEAYVATVNSGSGKYMAVSSDEEVATVSIDGKEVTVEAVGAGSATITVTDVETEQTGVINVNVSKVFENPSDPIDMGLPSGTKWAAYNVGATKPEEFGGLYAWGEIVENGKYDWETYLYSDAEGDVYDNLGNDISGTAYDVAHVRWGGDWRMPTYEQFKELVDNCSPKWTKRGDVQGMEFTGLNGAVLFLPAAGYYVDNTLWHPNASGGYWTSTLWEDYDRDAFYYCFSSFLNFVNNEMRYIGHSIRPVVNGTPSPLQDLVLASTAPIRMMDGERTTVDIISGNGVYDIASSDETLVSLNIMGNTLEIESLKPGVTTVTVTDVKTGQKEAIVVTIVDNTPQPGTPAEPVDLGLPSGTLWASYNLGATRPEDFGGYYAWGELEARSSFEWESYQYYNFNDGWIHIGEDIGGTNYDVARKLWGDEWRMPSSAQFQELKDNCTIKETEVNGVYGRLFTGKNGKSIFLPAAGSYFEKDNKYKGYYGYYWSSTLNSTDNGCAEILFFKKRGELMVGKDGRANGDCVRPVRTPGTVVPDLVLESTAPLSLKTRQGTGVNILSGSGSYTAKSDDDSVATADISDWVSLETAEKGKCVKVKAMGVGTATITVTDIQSSQQVSFIVTVTQNVDLLKLSVSSLELKVGETGDIVITSSSGAQYLTASSDASVATISIDKTTNTIKVLAMGAGTCDVTVNDSETGETATVIVTVLKANVAAKAVDLGLPSGTKWASFNIGATKPEEYGDYFAFGETESKTVYNWQSYKYSKGNTDECINLGDISGTQYDAARAVWGDEWRMPTYAECEELISKCTSQWTSIGGVWGRKITGPNGNSIFLPAGGAFDENYADSQGSYGWYWTSLQYSGQATTYAGSIVFNKSIINTNGYLRSLGFLIRPVKAK